MGAVSSLPLVEDETSLGLMVNWAETRVSAESATVRLLRIMMAACEVMKLLYFLLDGDGGDGIDEFGRRRRRSPASTRRLRECERDEGWE